MLSSLRTTILLSMLGVVTVAIATMTLFAVLTTRFEFSRYVNIGRELRADRMEQVVLNYFTTADVTTTDSADNWTIPPPSAGENALTDNTQVPRKMVYLDPDNFRFFALDAGEITLSPEMEVAPGNIELITAPDGRVQIMSDGMPVGVFYVEPEDVNEMALQAAQWDFMSAVNWGMLLAAGAAGLAAVVLTLVLSRRILHPLAQLTGAAQHLKAGDLSKRVNITPKGEIGELARAFNAMAETLSRNETLRQTMVSDIAHELRTPLTNIRGYIEGIQDGVLEADPSTIELIHEEVIWLNRIISDLQELALAEAGQLRFSKQETAIDDLLESAVMKYQPRARSAGITLKADIPYRMPSVFADSKRTSQIIRNLISNAIKYTPAGGSVTVTAAAHLKHIEVRVTDTGTGIAPEHLPYIFERFYRVDPSRSRDTGGAGLGLAIVKHLVEAQAGVIRVHSEVGKGSTFTFTLPIYLRQHAPIHDESMLDPVPLPTP